MALVGEDLQAGPFADEVGFGLDQRGQHLAFVDSGSPAGVQTRWSFRPQKQREWERL
ncbi:hypothetical protein [Kitasatospora sp. NPDC059673]|uniref:hypothetical protein n=1 Tax=Kitasatospora sp. NPDC059673 TaxID=3346901 RepID=UPI00368CF45E